MTTSSTASGVVADSQRVFMSVKNGRTDIVVQIGVPATTADYGVLIPVPGEPELDDEPVDENDLIALDLATAPKIVTVTESQASDSSGSGCGCGALEANSVKGGDGNGPPGRGSENGVTTTEPVNIGPVSAVVLTGTDGDAVNAWLADNGFVIPEADQPTVEGYVGSDRYFIAIRRSEAAVSGSPSSIGIHYSLPGDHRMLSLGFARIGAASSVAFTLFLSAPSTVGVSAPFETISLDDLDPALLRADEYRTAVANAVFTRDSRAFVLESAHAASALTPQLSAKFQALPAPSAVITRLSTVINADALDEDAIFATPYTDAVRDERYVSLPRVSPVYAGFGVAVVLVLGGALRRRQRGSAARKRC